MNIFHKRQGQMSFQQAYFYTDTIHNFYPLLVDDNLKMVIISLSVGVSPTEINF
jgi:hypothetical protein